MIWRRGGSAADDIAGWWAISVISSSAGLMGREVREGGGSAAG